MSIEEMFAAHTKAMEANTVALIALTASLAGRTPVKEEKIESVKAVKETKAKEEKAEVTPEEKKPETGADKTPEPDTSTTDNVAYSVVRALVLKLAPTDREAIKAINAKHGISKVSALLTDEGNIDSVVTDQAKLNAVYADLLAVEEV
ncbi:hypothetical protein [Pseudomonas sp.]|uniref:hypothetical protein n=1 Tax=Pseudomonas sp. TaxID=306 RepID=UPI003FD81DC5